MSDLDRDGFLGAAATFWPAGWLEGEAFYGAPETKRYQEAWGRALARHEIWQAMVERIQSELPPGMGACDTTAPYAMAAQRCCIYPEGAAANKPAKPYGVIVALASVLVPYYHIYRIQIDVEAGTHLPGHMQPRPREGAEGVFADLLARHIERGKGFKEFPSEYESIIVPEISVGNLLPGRATLLDALFGEHRNSAP